MIAIVPGCKDTLGIGGAGVNVEGNEERYMLSSVVALI